MLTIPFLNIGLRSPFYRLDEVRQPPAPPKPRYSLDEYVAKSKREFGLADDTPRVTRNAKSKRCAMCGKRVSQRATTCSTKCRSKMSRAQKKKSARKHS